MRIGRYVKPIEPITGDTPGGLVFDRFQADQNLMAIAVVDEDGRPIGMVERHALFVKMAAAFGRELYAGRPVSGLMNHNPVIADEGESAEAFFRMADSADAGALMGGFIATRNGRYLGAGSILEILKAASAIHHRRAEQMAELASSLAVAEAEAQTSSRARSEFLAVMSHEIRTPLNGVLGVARLLERKLEQEDLRPYVGAILDSGESLLALLTDALDMSRAEAGVTQLDSEPLSLASVAEDVHTLWRARAEEKGLKLALDTDLGAGAHVRGDRVRIKQLFNNLVGNALKFTVEGQVTVRLSTRADGDALIVSGAVQDTGPGVPPAVAARIFEPFNTGEAGRGGAGAGLGLTICRQIVTAMGGQIDVTSGEGGEAAKGGATGGACFAFSMRLPAANAVVVEAPIHPAPTAHETLHVLVVDDNATNRFVASKLLETFGCTFELAESGAHAVEAAARQAFDLVLMDIQMPGMDGLEASRRIRDLGPDTAELPIVALTANAAERDARRYLAAGLDGVVCKPIDPAVLLDAIRNALTPADARAAA